MELTEIDLGLLLDQAEDGYLIPCRSSDGKVDLSARASSGDTLLHVAVGRRNSDEVRFLVARGLDVNAIGDCHTTPLCLACMAADTDMIGLLLKLGANPDLPDSSGVLPHQWLFRALCQGANE